MDDLSLIVQSLIDSEIDDIILDLVYEIHSSLKGIPEEQFDINNNGNKTKKLTITSNQSQTIPIEKQTCYCPNCGQANIVAVRFSYHLAKCLGAGRQSSRQAQRRIVDQIMIITASDDNPLNGEQFYRGEETISISEDGGSCTDSTSSSLTIITSNKNHRRSSSEDEEYREDFDYKDDEEEDDWKPKKRKRRLPTTNPNSNGKMNKNRNKKKEDVLVVMSPSSSKLDFDNCIIPLNKLCSMAKHVVIPLVPLSVNSITPSNDNVTFVNTEQISSHSLVPSPINLVEDDQSTIIMFKEDNE